MSALGLDFRILPAGVEEPAPGAGEPPADYAIRLARSKAESVAAENPSSVVLGADTVVVLAGEILGKPLDGHDAERTLFRLAGADHEVVTGCALVWKHESRHMEFAISTKVWMGSQPPDVIRAYVATGEPLDKAGSYAIQGVGGFLVERIEGSFTNVVGLPMREVVDALRVLGVVEARGTEASP